MMPTWVVALVAAIATHTLLALLPRFFPVPRKTDVDRSFEDLRQEYKWWGFLTLPLFFLIAPAASYCWWRLLLALSSPIGFTQDGALFALYPARAVWMVPAILLGILTSGPIIDAILRSRLKQRYREYVAYSDGKYGFDSKAIEKPVYWGGGALAAIGILMLSNWHATFTPTEIRFSPFFDLREHVFNYPDLVSIKTSTALVAPNGRTVHRERLYVLRFSDATYWSTRYDPSGATAAQMNSLMEAVSQRSGVSLSEVPVLTGEDF